MWLLLIAAGARLREWLEPHFEAPSFPIYDGANSQRDDEVEISRLNRIYPLDPTIDSGLNNGVSVPLNSHWSEDRDVMVATLASLPILGVRKVDFIEIGIVRDRVEVKAPRQAKNCRR